MRWLCIALLPLLLPGCDENKKRPGGIVDSESHWLETCDDDSTCGGLACVCGVCSRACDGVCEDFEDAVCAPVATCGPGEQICVPRDMTLDAGGPDGQRPDATGDAAAADAVFDAALDPDGAADAGPDAEVSPVDAGGPDAFVCPPENACCADEDCPEAGSRCAPAGSGRQGVVCALDAPAGNVCLPPQCVRDEQCAAGETCVQAGNEGFVVSTCVPQRCAQNEACVDQANGECVGFFTPCNTGGYGCWYPGNVCRIDEDCVQRAEPQVCLPTDLGTVCEPAQ